LSGFFGCVNDLEDELIRALGTVAVESLLEAQDELRSSVDSSGNRRSWRATRTAS